MTSLVRATAVAAAAALLTASCASTGAVPKPFPTPNGSTGSRGAAAFDSYALVGTALSLRGAPYRNGGVDPNGFDCSGFTQYVFAHHGVSLPREVREQFDVGTPVKQDEVEAGDLLFFTTKGPGATHVGIAIGGDGFVHAPSSAGVVRVERTTGAYWSRRFLAARRVAS